MAKVVEIVVNNIWNRFTRVEYNNMLYPNLVLLVSHVVDCILGVAVNKVIGQHKQAGFDKGEMDIWGKHNADQDGDLFFC